MGHIELHPLALKVESNSYTRQCCIKRIENDTVAAEETLWFQFDKSVVPPADSDCDSYLLAVIMTAMKENKDGVVRGEVSQQLLSNLTE